MGTPVTPGAHTAHREGRACPTWARSAHVRPDVSGVLELDLGGYGAFHSRRFDTMEVAPKVDQGVAIIARPHGFDLTEKHGVRANVHHGCDFAVQSADGAGNHGGTGHQPIPFHIGKTLLDRDALAREPDSRVLLIRCENIDAKAAVLTHNLVVLAATIDTDKQSWRLVRDAAHCRYCAAGQSTFAVTSDDVDRGP
ncbi:hypothetical protein CBM2633_P190007 [Cupriavidus taiwanensis]|uniref:Uncharacterized protein n=1 Tax=Cupriavidus taiwanensis TaxID=164546 RepID=A0A975XKA5_9BURK|nr:hypothetical protein CBM2585_P190005 [Cupriavidus taiwanensis]SOY74625.1 hypothetical protein CBM2592_P220006 [Cupriavidus taiwanensis]SOY75538.1 hypothetical protein CBM2589_P190006 [Cupriavidus taiwanensis]SOZ16303.1 hypothetical protein CBM2597_P140005 [Cupriavidus taiwanensis]SOZ92628.1 hypothetical protein CBM2622_P200007 [Cupriavidus taiwanensis]